jgi:DNA-binding transcriptional MerR regulator
MTKKLMSSRALSERYGVACRTIDRWLEDKILPPPIVINRRRYWDADLIDEYDQQRAAKAVAS